MNILGGDALHLPNAQMVNFVRPEVALDFSPSTLDLSLSVCLSYGVRVRQDYFYGVKDFSTACQQGGVYNRDFVTVRIERVSPVYDHVCSRLLSYVKYQAGREVGGP